MTRNRLISPWRRTFQWATTLLILLIPWFRLDGKSLLRIDIPELSLYFFGQVLRIEELYLMFLACLGVVLGFLLLTLVFGRVWCGWACPQTTLNDVAEWLARKLRLGLVRNRLQGPVWRKVVIQVCYMLLAFLVSANLMWYFIEPRQFFLKLVSFDLHPASWATLLIVLAAVFLDLAFVRRLMCSDFCPYGRIQTSLVDPGTLTLHLPDSEAPRCIKCHSCVRACPMNIDIRQGFQVECINCGRCLDACRRVMTPRGEDGLIRYSFGTEGKGVRALFNPRTLLVATAFAGIVAVLAVFVINRPMASLKISRSHLASDRKLGTGETAVFFNAWINNRDEERRSFDISARDAGTGTPMALKGQTHAIALDGGGNRRVDFVLVVPPQGKGDVTFILKDTNGTVAATANATLSPN